MSDKRRMNGDDYFDEWHDAGDAAFALLQDGLVAPPSFDVFKHGLEERRKRTRSPLSVRAYAHWLVAEFQARQEAA